MQAAWGGVSTERYQLNSRCEVCTGGGHTNSMGETRGDEGSMGSLITAVPRFCSSHGGLERTH